MHFTDSSQTGIITSNSIQEYFYKSISVAVKNQNIQASDDTVHYLVNLLTSFSRSEYFFEYNENGVTLKPLALMYAEALNGAGINERIRILQKLGDTALFVSGIFSDSLNNKLVDLDYYIAMGGNAYSYVSDSIRANNRNSATQQLFDELTSKFVDFVDVLNEVTENTSLASNADIMRIYEVWMRTGSKRSKTLLEKFGINPIKASTTDYKH